MERIGTSSDEGSSSPDVAASSGGVGKKMVRMVREGRKRGRGSTGRGRGLVAEVRPSKHVRPDPLFAPIRPPPSASRVMTSSEEASDASSAEVSPETSRISEAASRKIWKASRVAKAKAKRPSGRGRERIQVSAETSSDEDSGPPNVGDSLPNSSGLLDYVSWAVNNVLSETERDALSSVSPVCVGSMCTGMGTEDMACRAIEIAMLEAGKGAFRARSAYQAESDADKLAFLQRHSSKDTYIFDSNAALQHKEVQTVTGDLIPRPLCKILVAGIVCIDISGLTTTPQPVNGEGKSGLALRGLLLSLQGMMFEERPSVIILECVKRLAHHRKVDSDARTGAQFILDELSKLGYVGEWRTVSPRNLFFHSRGTECAP